MTKWTIDALAYAKGTSEPVRQALLAMHERLNALEQPEQVSHAHEWFRTGAMEPGKMRCIHCGASGNDASLTTLPQQQAEPVAQSDLIKRLRDTASKGVSVWGDLQMEAAREIEILTAERECYASAMDRMMAAQPEQQAKPLTDADIKLVMNGRGEEGDDAYIKPAFDPYGISEDDLLGFARAIEQAHGIKGEA